MSPDPNRIQFAPSVPTQLRTNVNFTTGVYAVRARENSVRLKPDPEAWSQFLEEEYTEKAQKGQTGWQLLWLAYQATGVVYGDIGTSPLYVYSSTFTSAPNPADVLGALSLIIWSLILVVTVKYVLIVLQADDHGEGGTFALYSLLTRNAHIARHDPRVLNIYKMQRARSRDLRPTSKTARDFIEHSALAKSALKILGVAGVALVMSDGILTPAQSIVGAVQGLELVDPTIRERTIVGVSCAMLVVLFAVQPFGTTKVASAFAPIVIIWLLFNGAFGIYNLVAFDASVLKAFSPSFAGDYFMRNKTSGWKSLGGILLCFTGVEAMYADLGSFSKRAIQLSWMCLAFPCLLLSYIGQAAFLLHDPTAYSNPFYLTVPPGMFYPSLVVAILAAVVASQAMITAVFQLLSQMMKLSYAPHLRLIHTSQRFFGQVYIPVANFIMLIGAIIVVTAFKNTTDLGHAYGICVLLVTTITTIMVTFIALIVWRLHGAIVIGGCVVFAFIDCVYLSASLTKIPGGAWVTVVLAVVISSFFLLWRYGKEEQWKGEGKTLAPLSSLIDFSVRKSPAITKQSSSEDKNGVTVTSEPRPLSRSQLSPLKAMSLFLDKAGSSHSTPAAFGHFIRKFHSCPEVVIFLHLRALPVPTVRPEDRYHVTRCFGGDSDEVDDDYETPSTTPAATDQPQPTFQPKPPRFDGFRLIIRHGYTDEVVTTNLALLSLDQIRNFIIHEAHENSEKRRRAAARIAQGGGPVVSRRRDTEEGTMETIRARHARLTEAYDAQVLYVIGNEQLRLKKRNNADADNESETRGRSPSVPDAPPGPGSASVMSAASVTTTTIDGEKKPRTGASRWIRQNMRRAALGLYLWLRENARRKVRNWDLEIERLVEIGYVCEM